MSDKLENMLIRQEALKLKPYLDCCGKPWRECKCSKKGKLTVGIGRNLDDNGITEAEARMMCRYDVEAVRAPLLKYKWFTLLNEARQDVILDMAFNMGLPTFFQFKNMIKALQDLDYHKAAEEMMASQWSQQVGERATELAAMMVEGRYLNR